MKRILMLALMMVMVSVFSMQAHATLLNRGTDSLGNRLIYDTDLDITWYDFTNYRDRWQNQMDWASGLTVDFGGTVFDDWRLPTTVDEPDSWGYDGSTVLGYNITSSEMGHLFYTELGNDGYYDTSGNLTGCSNSSPYCLTNTGDFQNIMADWYWSTEILYDPAMTIYYARTFEFAYGSQDFDDKLGSNYAIAVRDGDVSAVPEPSTMLLLGSGLAGLLGFRKKLNV